MIAEAVAAIDRDRLVRGCASMVDVAAPTGFERPCAEEIVTQLVERGVDASLMVLDDHAANAWGRIAARGPRAGTAPTLMLYSPIDTVTTGDPSEDVPQVADAIDGHLVASAAVSADGEVVSGLGAQNPKGHAACILEAAAVLAQHADRLNGDVIVAFGAGGMPTFELDRDDRTDTGHGRGVDALISQLRDSGVVLDAAVIAKSGWFVQHEEVGLAWIDLVVRGSHTYVGARHQLPYRNAVADAAGVVIALEAFFAEPSGIRSTNTLEPQAMVASLHAGWTRMAAFLPASAKIRVDYRLLPGETADDALLAVTRVVDALRADDPGLVVEASIAVEVLASHTDVDHWICAAGHRSWTAIEGVESPVPERQSGSTDANNIRNAGIPAIRIGLPKLHVDGAELGFAEGMNTVSTSGMERLTELLVRTVLDVSANEQRSAA